MSICKHVNDKEEKCKTRANYNIPREKALYCFKHKKEGMIDVIHKRCIEKDCKKQPTYNLEGEKALYCAKHNKEGMINVVNKRCIEKDCKKIPNYNIPGEKKGIYCVTHKKEDMIDVVNKRCIEKDCKKQPTYNLEGEKALYCAKHNKEGMIDVVNKRCIEKDCKKQPSYNLPREKKGIYCVTHKKEGMIDVIHKRCIEKDCKIRPTYNIEGEKEALYCYIHKKENMIDVVNKRCLTPLCDTLPSKEGYCSRCFYYTFPDKPQARNYKSKEILVTNYIKDNFKDYEITYDQIISNACSRRRPDIFIELYTHCIIVEVDEDQHLRYDSTCENKRIVELYQDLGYRNIVYIRFNPDKYKIKDDNGIEKTIRSCFSKDKDGKIKIGSTKDWNHRLQKLKECIAKNIENIPSKSISYEYLFYDDSKIQKK
jgi:hypothetical protein